MEFGFEPAPDQLAQWNLAFRTSTGPLQVPSKTSCRYLVAVTISGKHEPVYESQSDVTGHLADWSTRGLDNSWSRQLADWTTRGCCQQEYLLF